jgi:hypothetical protein
MGTKSRDTIFGPSIRPSAGRAAAARKEADLRSLEFRRTTRSWIKS